MIVDYIEPGSHFEEEGRMSCYSGGKFVRYIYADEFDATTTDLSFTPKALVAVMRCIEQFRAGKQ